jgi:hypothetical protein
VRTTAYSLWQLKREVVLRFLGRCWLAVRGARGVSLTDSVLAGCGPKMWGAERVGRSGRDGRAASRVVENWRALPNRFFGMGGGSCCSKSTSVPMLTLPHTTMRNTPVAVGARRYTRHRPCAERCARCSSRGRGRASREGSCSGGGSSAGPSVE